MLKHFFFASKISNAFVQFHRVNANNIGRLDACIIRSFARPYVRTYVFPLLLLTSFTSTMSIDWKLFFSFDGIFKTKKFLSIDNHHQCRLFLLIAVSIFPPAHSPFLINEPTNVSITHPVLLCSDLITSFCCSLRWPLYTAVLHSITAFYLSFILIELFLYTKASMMRMCLS